MKLFKIFFIFIFLFFVSCSYANAIDMYLTANNSIEATNTETTTSLEVPSYNSSVVISSTSADVNNELSTSDIINIILIAVGVVIIFLAVAILIRCK